MEFGGEAAIGSGGLAVHQAWNWNEKKKNRGRGTRGWHEMKCVVFEVEMRRMSFSLPVRLLRLILTSKIRSSSFAPNKEIFYFFLCHFDR